MQILASVIWFQPQYRSRHPVNCMFLLYKRIKVSPKYWIWLWEQNHYLASHPCFPHRCTNPSKWMHQTGENERGYPALPFWPCNCFFFSVFFPLVSSRSDFDKMLDSWQPSRQTYRDVPTCTCQKLVRKAKIYKWKANGEVSWSAGRARRERLRLVAYSRTLLSFSVAHLVVLFPLIFMLRLLVLLSFGGPKCDVFEPLLFFVFYFAM